MTNANAEHFAKCRLRLKDCPRCLRFIGSTTAAERLEMRLERLRKKKEGEA